MLRNEYLEREEQTNYIPTPILDADAYVIRAGLAAAGSHLFKANPNYVSPQSKPQKILNNVIRVGHGLTGVSIMLDLFRLEQQHKISQRTGNYDPLYRESARIVGGWSGAYAGGAVGMKAGAVACSPVAPPVGPAVCGVLGGIAGSIAGYYGGDALAARVYDVMNGDAPLPTFINKLNPISDAHAEEIPPLVGKAQDVIIKKSKNNEVLHARKQPATPVANAPSEIFISKKKILAAEEKVLITLNNVHSILSGNLIKEFEHNKKMKKLKSELDALQQEKSDIQKVGEKVNEINKLSVELYYEQKGVAHNMQVAKNILNGAAVLGMVFGHDKFAQQVVVVGNTILNVCESLTQYALGSMTGAVATGNIIACLPAFISLLKSKGVDGTQLQLKNILMLLQSVCKQMHDRFDQQEYKIDAGQQDAYREFMSLRFENNQLSGKLELFHYRTDRKLENVESFIKKIKDILKIFLDEHANEVIYNVLLTMQENLNAKLFFLTNPLDSESHAAYKDARSEIHKYVATPGGGIAHKTLIGDGFDEMKLSIKRIDNKPVFFSLNTLASFCKQIQSPKFQVLSAEGMREKLLDVATRNKNLTILDIASTRHIVDNANPKNEYNVESLSTMIMQSSNVKVLMIPIYINGCWNALIINNETKKIDFYSAIVNLLVIQQIKKVTEKANPGYSFGEHDVSKEADSAKWLLKFAENFNKNPMEITSHQTLASEKQQIKSSQPAIYNIYAFQLLCVRLLEATHHYYQRKLMDGHAIVSSSEVGVMQNFIDLNDQFYDLIKRFFDESIFIELVKRYQLSQKQYQAAYSEHKSKHEAMIDKEITDAENTVIKENLAKRDSDNYVENPNSCERHGQWFTHGEYTQACNKGKRKPFNVVRENNHKDWGYGKKYSDAQIATIRALKTDYLKERDSYFSKCKHHDHFKMDAKFSPQELLPVFIVPLDKNLPLIRTDRNIFMHFNPDMQERLLRAQSLALGSIKYYYQIQNENNRSFFDIHINFVTPDEKQVLPFAILRTNYNPLFYKGAEAIHWFAEGGRYANTIANGDLVQLYTYQGVPPHNTFTEYGYSPKLSLNEGLLHRIAKGTAALQNQMDEKSEVYQKSFAELNCLLEKKQQYLEKRFQNEMAQAHGSGEIAAAANCTYNYFYLLKCFCQLVCCEEMSDQQSFLYKLFAKPSLTAPSNELTELLSRVKARINLREPLRLPIIDDMLEHLLMTADMMRQIKYIATDSEQAEYYSKVSSAMSQLINSMTDDDLDSINPEDALVRLRLLRDCNRLKTQLDADFKKTGKVNLLLTDSLKGLLADGESKAAGKLPDGKEAKRTEGRESKPYSLLDSAAGPRLFAPANRGTSGQSVASANRGAGRQQAAPANTHPPAAGAGMWASWR